MASAGVIFRIENVDQSGPFPAGSGNQSLSSLGCIFEGGSAQFCIYELGEVRRTSHIGDKPSRSISTRRP